MRKSLFILLFFVLDLISFPSLTHASKDSKDSKEYHLTLPEIEVKEYNAQNNIHEADSILALTMLLNRECPTCSYEEKVYWASCTTYGVKKGYWTWKEFVFKKKQFWDFKDKRIKYSPKKRLHKENLKAVKEAWENPKPVMFYASKIDTANNSLHYKQVKRNAVWQGHHYFSLNLK